MIHRPSNWNRLLKGLLIALPLSATTACQSPHSQGNNSFPIGAVIALTGNYNADQVHIPPLRERLGQ